MITDADFLEWLTDPRQTRVILIDLQAWSSGAAVTRRVSNFPWVSEPSDSPANTPWENILLDGPVWQTGASGMGGGQITIDNGDGSRDSWLEDAWEGRPFVVRLGAPRWPLSDFRVVRSGLIEGISAADQRSISIVFRDAKARLDKPLQANLIGGTGPNKDAPIPLLFGQCFNLEPVLIDEGSRTYQIHDGAVQAILAVRDRGIPVLFSADCAAGKFSLTVSAGGQLTVDAVGFGTADAGEVVVTVPGAYISGLTYVLPATTVSRIDAVRFRGSPISYSANLAARTVTLGAWPVTVTADVNTATDQTVTTAVIAGTATAVLPITTAGRVVVHSVSLAGYSTTFSAAGTQVQILTTAAPVAVQMYSADYGDWAWAAVSHVDGLTYSFSPPDSTYTVISLVQVAGADAQYSQSGSQITVFIPTSLMVSASTTVYDPHAAVTCSHVSGLIWAIGIDAAEVSAVYVDSVGVAFSADVSLDRVTLVSPPSGTLEADIPVYAATTADVVQALVTRSGLLDVSEIDADNIDAFRATVPAPIGIFVRERSNAGTVLDELLVAVRGGWLFDRADKLRLWRRDLPSGTPADAFDAGDAQLGQLATEGDPEKPVKKLKVGARRNWTVQDRSGLLSGVSDSNREAWGNPYILAPGVAEQAAGWSDQYLQALEPDLIESYFVAAADALAEAERRIEIGAAPRRIWKLPVARLAWLEIGDVVQLIHPRLGWAAGELAVVVGLTEDWRRNSMELKLWR